MPSNRQESLTIQTPASRGLDERPKLPRHFKRSNERAGIKEPAAPLAGFLRTGAGVVLDGAGSHHLLPANGGSRSGPGTAQRAVNPAHLYLYAAVPEIGRAH